MVDYSIILYFAIRVVKISYGSMGGRKVLVWNFCERKLSDIALRSIDIAKVTDICPGFRD